MTRNPLRIVAHAIKDRGSWALIHTLQAHSELPPDLGVVWKAIDKWYETDPEAMAVDLESVIDKIQNQNPRYKDDFKRMGDSIRDLPVSTANFKEDLAEYLRRDAAVKLVTAITTNKPWDSVEAEITALQDVLSRLHQVEDTKVYQGVPVEEVLRITDPENLIQLHPPELNEYLNGGVPRPGHMLIFARPNMGKTSFLLNQAKQFCRDGYPTLYFNNEDNPQQFLLRTLTVFCGVQRSLIEQHPEKATRVLENLGYENLTTVFSDQGTLDEIEGLIQKHKCKIAIIDQMRNLHTKAESRNLELEGIARGIRALARRTNTLVISVNQAGESASDKSYLDMEDLDYSKTGVQGALDLMVGLGASQSDRAAGYICVSIPRSKTSNQQFGPKLRFDGKTGVYVA